MICGAFLHFVLFLYGSGQHQNGSAIYKYILTIYFQNTSEFNVYLKTIINLIFILFSTFIRENNLNFKLETKKYLKRK